MGAAPEKIQDVSPDHACENQSINFAEPIVGWTLEQSMYETVSDRSPTFDTGRSADPSVTDRRGWQAY